MWKNEKKPSFLWHSTHKSMTKEQQQCQIRIVIHNKIVMLSLQKNAVKGNCVVNPKPVQMELARRHLKENCLLQNLCRNPPEGMCSSTRQDPVPGSWMGLWHCSSSSAPDWPGGCWAQTCAPLLLSNAAASCRDTAQGFSYPHTRVTSAQQAATAPKHLSFITYSFISPLFLLDSVTDISLPFQAAACLHSVAKQSQTEVLQI